MSTVFLVGAKAIKEELERLGLIPKNDPNGEDRVYYLARTKQLPIGRLGNNLITTPEKLQRSAEKLVP